MKTIRILKYSDPLAHHRDYKLRAAASDMSRCTAFDIIPTEAGFIVSGEWRGRFVSEEAFVRRAARDLQLLSGVIFDSVVEDGIAK
jgi:hypothetical protein